MLGDGWLSRSLFLKLLQALLGDTPGLILQLFSRLFIKYFIKSQISSYVLFFSHSLL